MTKKIRSVLSVLVLATLSLGAGGCANTPQENIALAGAASGNAYATYELGKATTPAATAATVKALTDLAAELPNIPLGKVSTFNLGALQAELKVAKANLITNVAAENQIVSLIALVANNQGTLTSGIVTADQALVYGAFANVASGITNALQFAAGQASVAPTSFNLPLPQPFVGLIPESEPDGSVMLFSATSGELLKWLPRATFEADLARKSDFSFVPATP